MPNKPEVPKPPIFLRNNFVVKPGRSSQFLTGKANLIKNTMGRWTLVAACADRPMILGRGSPHPSLRMMQIWRLDEWDTLYNTIFTLSEMGWYRKLGDSLSEESQEFLVGVTSGFGLEPRPNWADDNDPNYSYVYEEVLPLPGQSRLYLRDLNWFTSTLRTLNEGWDWLWSATQVTAGPSVICSLWKVPQGSSFEQAERTLLAADREAQLNAKAARALGVDVPGPTYAARYRRMTERVATVIRRVPQYPIYSERLDERLRTEDFETVVNDL
jgi:hypothetical protein